MGKIGIAHRTLVPMGLYLNITMRSFEYELTRSEESNLLLQKEVSQLQETSASSSFA